MSSSIFLAQAFGLYMVIIGLCLLIGKNHYQKAARSLVENDGVMFLTSIVTLILGIILVLFHNLWVWDWRLVVTLLVWLTFIKGIVRLAFPAHVKKWVSVFENDKWFYTILVITVLVGIYLLIMGFFVGGS